MLYQLYLEKIAQIYVDDTYKNSRLSDKARRAAHLQTKPVAPRHAALKHEFEQRMLNKGIAHGKSPKLRLKKYASTPAWTRKEGKDPEGGLNRKGVASYRKANPGSKLQMAVTTEPSKLDPDSKAAKRRKSFCARMSGMRGAMKDAKGRPTRKALALRKWNC